VIARIRAARQRRRAAKAKARRIGLALRDLAQMDAEIRGYVKQPDGSWTRDLLGIVRQEEAGR